MNYTSFSLSGGEMRPGFFGVSFDKTFQRRKTSSLCKKNLAQPAGPSLNDWSGACSPPARAAAIRLAKRDLTLV
ncbi:hypothetical protein ACQE3D_00505 [Methylomonas sp. MS20]|uniref:hypothetical protein n=1 Tax=unclassified Methylomonas TaxID=2608980 RepID=UPI00169C476A|nr:hypothetical protein [Methylomonas sp. MV1]MDT4330646.1 hypothetical protein [Methylomonas sp. MV1]NJA06021.1 hypothetical protein [Methylococcaceae bacterium WWC4]